MPPHIPLDGVEPDDVIVIKRSDSSESAALAVDPVDSAKHQQQPSIASSSRQSGQYTVEEVARHNKKDDAWLIYNNKVLDVSKWVSS
jgi:cytochrome b involved in lipid metabolism